MANNDIPLLKMDGIEKWFTGVHALNQAQFELFSGEVHALVGENGAGKSTLMKVLSGIYPKDKGTIVYQGKEISLHNPKDALDSGICIIHQELNLIPHLTVAQNIFIGREKSKKNKFLVDDARITRQAKELLSELHIDLDPDTKVSTLTVAMQQMVEIAKALSFDSKIIIMDEPTAPLTDTEIQQLFRIINKLKNDGVGVVYISHRLDELQVVTDRITVMRDGSYIGTIGTAEATKDKIISMMIGRTIFESSEKITDINAGEVILEVKNLNRGRMIRDISFSIRRGEIVGVSGLVGAGRTEMARAIIGADPLESGEIYVRGEKVHIRTPKDAVTHGIGYLSEDRKQYGVVLGMDIEANIAMASMEKFTGKLGVIDMANTGSTANEYVHKLSIKTPSIRQKVRYLSGGNQQKVIIGKWLVNDSDVLIFDEPTRGIDVGAKSEIYKLLNELARNGKAIIMISSELPEIMRMSHRVLVMCEGRITGEIPRSEVTEEKVMQFATMRKSSVQK